MEKIADIVDGLIIAWVELSELKEQDINAHAMDNAMFTQLKSNVEKRGALESLPLCALRNERIEIISGHHRARAAKLANLQRIPVLVDTTGLSRSALVAKQLAHNALVGYDDKSVIDILSKEMIELDHVVESYIKNIDFTPIEEESAKSIDVNFYPEWRDVSFLFLPETFDKFQDMVGQVNKADLLGVVSYKQYEPFCEALRQFKKFSCVKNTGAALDLVINSMKKDIEEAQLPADEELVPLSQLFGKCGVVPEKIASEMKNRIKTIRESHDILPSQGWKVIACLLNMEV
jgi:hypothetical protein